MSGVFTEQSSCYLAFPQKLAQHLYFRLHEPGHAKRGAAQPDTDWTTLLKQLGLHSVAMDLSNMPGRQNPDATAHPEPTHDTGPHPQRFWPGQNAFHVWQ